MLYCLRWDWYENVVVRQAQTGQLISFAGNNHDNFLQFLCQDRQVLVAGSAPAGNTPVNDMFFSFSATVFLRFAAGNTPVTDMSASL